MALLSGPLGFLQMSSRVYGKNISWGIDQNDSLTKVFQKFKVTKFHYYFNGNILSKNIIKPP